MLAGVASTTALRAASMPTGARPIPNAIALRERVGRLTPVGSDV
jgi:hypothetical protein